MPNRNQKLINLHASKKSLLLFPLLLATILCGVVVSAYAIGTQVTATLCDATSGPDLIINSPSVGYVVSEPTIHLQGTAIRTSQIDISLNGNYSSTIAIGSDEVLNTDVSLVPGENTITLDASYSCNHTSQTTTLLATYNLAVVPNTDTTPPVIAGTENSPTISSSPNKSISNPPSLTLPERIKRNLGFPPEHGQSQQQEQYYRSSTVKKTFSWLSVFIIIGGAFLLVAPMHIITLLPKIYRNKKWYSSSRLRLIIRIVILILILLLALLLQL